MENTTLVLRTFDANTSLQNTYYVWENINLRNLMGNMYDKYEKFNLCLTSISSTNANATLGTLLEDTMVVANISGLPFINQTYNTKTGNNTNTATLCSFQFQRSLGINLYFYNVDLCFFIGMLISIIIANIQSFNLSSKRIRYEISHCERYRLQSAVRHVQRLQYQ